MEIPRIPAKASPLFFDEFYRHELPVIITGLVREWPCFTTWTADALRSAGAPSVRHLSALGSALAADYGIRSLFPDPDAFSFSSVLVIGEPRAKTSFGYAWTHDFVGMIRGIKRVALLPPGAEQSMVIDDEMRATLAAGNGVAFDALPDLDVGGAIHEHPVFARCPQVLTGSLADGDVVFYPSHWYRYAHEVTETISVTTQTLSYDG